MSTDNNLVSIIIPTYNEEYNLKRLLDSLETISEYVEVIVVDNFSVDDTIKVAEQYSFVKILQVKGTPGKARNVGIKNSKYNIIAMLDADTKICDTWYDELISSIQSYSIVAGYSPDPYGHHLPRVPVIIDGQDITYPQCNIAYTVDVFKIVGLLREDMVCAEDCEFHYRCIKNGFIICYNPLMKAYHYERTSFWKWMRKQVKNGYGRYELNRIHPNLKHLHEHGFSFKTILRLFFGMIGYLKAMIGLKGGDKR